MNILEKLEKKGKPFWVIAGIILIVGIGILDFLTGYEISFSLFYLFPIALVTWFTGRRFGLAATVVSAWVWFIAERSSGHSYSHVAIAYWNSAIRFGFFIIVMLLLATLKKTLEQEKNLARVDNLTGAVNARCFTELVEMEIARAQRYKHPLTVAYVDLDNFKTVNDRFGHSTGDKVLYTVVQNTRRQLRKIDIVARLGGDEFAILLPETGQTAAQAAIAKIQLFLLDEMRKNDWPVTFSIGVLTCVDLPKTTDELIKRADDLMYSVKSSGKNSINYSLYTG